jgi:hypothetical protein
MTIAFAQLVVRSPRRIRLLFSGALALGAFGPGASVSGLYVITCTDGSGASPALAAAIALPAETGNVELALATDLAAGGVYQVVSVGVPGADTSVSALASATFTYGGLAAPTIDVEQAQPDIAALVYGVDLVWTGADYLETSAGDLATVAGVPNVEGAIGRRLTDEDGLPWDGGYGARAGNYVNGPSANGGSLVGALRRQAVADDRVRSATVSWTDDPNSPGDNYFPVTVLFRGAAPGDGFTVNVPTPTPSGAGVSGVFAPPAPPVNVEVSQSDVASLVYGLDLVWTGADFLETPAGDLASISGIPNVEGAMQRRLVDEDGLPWDGTYGARSGDFVNGPAPNGLSLVGALRRQAVADDRVASATVSWLEDPNSPGDNYFPVTIFFRGAAPGDGFTTNVNPPGTS